jgi:sialic acid synthase SpsE
MARQLVVKAHEANVDAIKLQTKNPEKAFRKELLDMPYTNDNSFGATYREHKYALELSEEETGELFEMASELGLIPFSSPFDLDSVDMLERLGQRLYKIASFHVTDLELLERVCQTGKPIIMSTGMSTWEEIDLAVELIRKYTEDFVLLQCTSSYPAEYEDLNLAAIPAIRNRYNCLVGYSGHERGVGIGPGSVLLGACVIERHFTLDRTLKGPDHAASLEPRGLDLLVKRSLNYWHALGLPNKEVRESELANRQKFRGY